MRGKIQDILILLFLSPALCIATTIAFYTDGVIQDGDVYDYVSVYDNAKVGMTGGTVTTQLNAYESSTINFYAGSVGGSISIHNSSTFNLESGTLSNINFGMYHSSTFNINDGLFEGHISGLGNRISINGGTINILESGMSYYSIMDIYHGIVTFCDDMLFDRWAVLNIYGGSVTFKGNSLGDAFRMSPWASFNVYYSDIIYGSSGAEIVGYHLLDGSEFMLDQFTQTEINRINFVPEPSTFILMLLGAFLVKKKNR